MWGSGTREAVTDGPPDSPADWFSSRPDLCWTAGLRGAAAVSGVPARRSIDEMSRDRLLGPDCRSVRLRTCRGCRGRRAQQVEDCHALPDQPGEHLVDAGRAVQDGQVGSGYAACRRLNQLWQLLDDPVRGDELLVSFSQRGGSRVVGVGLTLGRRPLRVGGFLVGLGRADPGRAGNRRGMRGSEVIDVTRRVLDFLDLQGIDDDAELLHLGVAAVLDLLSDPVALPDDLLDGEPADDRPQVAGEYPAHQNLHPVLLRQEPAGTVRDPVPGGP